MDGFLKKTILSMVIFSQAMVICQGINHAIPARYTSKMDQLVTNKKKTLVLGLLAGSCIGYHIYRSYSFHSIKQKAKLAAQNRYEKPSDATDHDTITIGVHGLWGSEDLGEFCWFDQDKNPGGFLISHKHQLYTFSFDDACVDYWKQHIAKYRNQNLSSRDIVHQVKTLDTLTEEDRKRFHRAAIAQEKDIKQLRENVEKILKEKEQCKNIILAGVSRGASTIVTYMGSNQVPQEIKALLLEAPFADPRHPQIARLKKHHMHWVPGAQTFFDLYGACYVFPNYSTCGIRPIDVAEYLPKELPILLACTLDDAIVPATSTIYLYKHLIQTGHTNVYLYVVDKSDHGRIAFGDYAAEYRNLTHAFFAEHGLPHEVAWAQASQDRLQQCKISCEQLNQSYGI